jgi:hypothetical protein
MDHISRCHQKEYQAAQDRTIPLLFHYRRVAAHLYLDIFWQPDTIALKAIQVQLPSVSFKRIVAAYP